MKVTSSLSDPRQETTIPSKLILDKSIFTVTLKLWICNQVEIFKIHLNKTDLWLNLKTDCLVLMAKELLSTPKEETSEIQICKIDISIIVTSHRKTIIWVLKLDFSVLKTANLRSYLLDKFKCKLLWIRFKKWMVWIDWLRTMTLVKMLERLRTLQALKTMIRDHMKCEVKALKISQDFFLLSLNIMPVREILRLHQFLDPWKVHIIIWTRKVQKVERVELLLSINTIV